jgi:hypothetical protein
MIFWKCQGDAPFEDHGVDPLRHRDQLGLMLKIVRNQDSDQDILKVIAERSHSKNNPMSTFAIEIK